MALIFAIAAIFGNTIVLAEETPQENRDAQRQRIREAAYQESLRRRMQGLPSNPNETPTTPKTLRHDKERSPRGDLKRRPYNIEEARIYFGTDEEGKPCYQSVGEHFENNPKFHEVGLVLYQPGWFSETFENIGTMADENAQTKLKDTMSDMSGYLLWKHKNHGAWCPEQNVFIGGTGDVGKTDSNGKATRNMCEVYAQFLEAKQQAVQTK